MRTRRQRLQAAILCCGLAFSAAVAGACNIPVFRYALERWTPDQTEVVIFHDQPLTDEESQIVVRLQSAEHSNCTVIQCDSATTTDESLKQLWATVRRTQPESSLPLLVARSRHGRNRIVNHWTSPLSRIIDGSLLNSPARTELVRRLQSGDAVVWLLLKSHDSERTARTITLLQQQCQRLPGIVELPEGIGLPGSELYSEIPLLLQFSVLAIDPDDPREQFLVQQLTGFQPEAVAKGDPLIVPVFGRGRALEVIPAAEFSSDLMQELTAYLCGACSCQVKEQNPGFDLLLTSDWSLALFGEDAELPPPPAETGTGQKPKPELVPIPSGQRKLK